MYAAATLQNITGFSLEACEHLHANGALKALEELLNDDDPALAEFASGALANLHTNLGETLGPTSGETEAALNRRRALDVAAAMQQRSAAKVMQRSVRAFSARRLRNAMPRIPPPPEPLITRGAAAATSGGAASPAPPAATRPLVLLLGAEGARDELCAALRSHLGSRAGAADARPRGGGERRRRRDRGAAARHLVARRSSRRPRSSSHSWPAPSRPTTEEAPARSSMCSSTFLAPPAS